MNGEDQLLRLPSDVCRHRGISAPIFTGAGVEEEEEQGKRKGGRGEEKKEEEEKEKEKKQEEKGEEKEEEECSFVSKISSVPEIAHGKEQRLKLCKTEYVTE